MHSTIFLARVADVGLPCYVGVVKASLKKIVLNTGASKRIDTKVLSVAILLPQRYPYSGPVCPPFKKGQTGPFVMKRSRWGIARRFVQQPAIRWFSSRAQRPVWEESSVDGIRRGRIKLLIGFIQGDSDLDLVRTFRALIGCVSPTTDSGNGFSLDFYFASFIASWA